MTTTVPVLPLNVKYLEYLVIKEMLRDLSSLSRWMDLLRKLVWAVKGVYVLRKQVYA